MAKVGRARAEEHFSGGVERLTAHVKPQNRGGGLELLALPRKLEALHLQLLLLDRESISLELKLTLAEHVLRG